ncbi:MAG TPA: hypothetical protein VLD19_00045 [Chitinophagaceae bacterium]|nr:hypothetical protein [Chitinophagaceae bacterium]
MSRLTGNTIIAFCLSAFFFACKKDGGNAATNFVFSYGDSIFYLKNQAADYIVSPVQAKPGHYSGFPEGITIDNNTGAVNISKSETGLRYRITFVPDAGNDSFSTVILISGINFKDGFYKLAAGDSILKPVYNASDANAVPGINNGSLFDEGGGCNSQGCRVDPASGAINLSQTVRNGVFGSTPTNNDRHEFQLNYRINDNSGKAANTIRVKLYCFNTINDVTQEVYDIINSRVGTIFRTSEGFPSGVFNGRAITGARVQEFGRPRPPCIFIISH